jgi:hypothetical protein
VVTHHFCVSVGTAAVPLRARMASLAPALRLDRESLEVTPADLAVMLGRKVQSFLLEQ